MPRGVGSAAEAVERIIRAHGVSVEHARQLVTDGARKLGAVAVGPSNGRRRDVMGAEIADAWFDFGDEDDGHADPPALVADADERGAYALIATIMHPQLELDLLEIDTYAAAVLGKPRHETEGSPARDRGGRPVEHDWRRAVRQVLLLRVREYGWPARKGELTSELLDWFALHFTEPPDQRTVERFVAAIWPHGPCELRPRDAGDETS